MASTIQHTFWLYTMLAGEVASKHKILQLLVNVKPLLPRRMFGPIRSNLALTRPASGHWHWLKHGGFW